MISENLLSNLNLLAASHADANQPEAVFRAVDQALLRTVSHKLFTILMYDTAITESIRVYSNLSNDYPLGGRKKIVSQRWANQVIREGEPFIGNTAEDLEQVFSDHALIQSLGCESVLNMPVRWKGRTVGTLNLLHDKGWYRDVDLASVASFAQLTLPGLLQLELADRN
jgi:GAF domain-containing protein